ncbi:copper amine oxidase [Podospora conica]|nr:copper amine oxidase [Schizothecium conicum]
MTSQHPFDPLTPAEIELAADIVKKTFDNGALLFRVITLLEPPKAEMMPFLDFEHKVTDTPAKTPARMALVHVYVDKIFHELKVDLDQRSVPSDEVLEGRHAHIDPDFHHQVEVACLADPEVQKLVEDMKLPEGATVVVEPWVYGTDGLNDMSERLTMCWFYMRLSSDPDANFYAYPLSLCIEMSASMQVRKVFHLTSNSRPHPFDPRKVHSGSEYHPNLTPAARTTTMPLHITQPQGPSFSLSESSHHLAWESWTLRLGFNYREGLTLHDVRFAGRSLFYRLSLAEMFVPYADPRPPYPRKAAFDLGNDGAGACANSLRLGCDCLGHIAYLSTHVPTPEGRASCVPNVVCVHEVDDGILWKHTNTRTGNAVVARARSLVLQTIITASNYEYIFAFVLGQDAALTYEVRATGIVSTVPVGVGETSEWGAVVAPGVLAPSHQHLFCLRVDPAVDGWKNSVQMTETHPLDPSPETNPHGNAFTTTSSLLPTESAHHLSHTANRTFTIVNESRLHPHTRTPVGYRLLPHYSQLLLAHPTSHHALRAEYASHAVWVTRHRDEELFPAGRWTMQSAGGEGIRSWVAGRAEEGAEVNGIRGEDIVVWHTFGSTHHPRAEDWPVMPVEKMAVGLKPVNFFERSPALDVAVARMGEGKSVLFGNGGGDGRAGCKTGGC